MPSTRKLLVVLGLIVLFGCSAAALGRASVAPRWPRFLWGAWIGTQFTGSEPPWSWQAVQDFEAKNAGGRHVSVVAWGVAPPWLHDFDYGRGAFDAAEEGGTVPVVDMSTRGVRLRDIAAGAQDSALRTWAEEAKSWGHPFLLRFDFEMNGQWFAWGTRPKNHNTPASFVAAWRHVHRIFTAVGATNVAWVWCPNIDPYHKMTSLRRLYPGNAYVDWTCLDGYNRDAPWMSFTELFGDTYHRIMQLAPGKPMIIGEVASTGHGGNKAEWIRNMFHALATRFRHVHGLVWYDKYGLPTESGPRDWPIERSRSASAAFRKGISRTLARVCRGFAGAARARCMSGAIQ
jgi:hypothetical protein